jgi:cytochrome c-type biogenesis protein CcmH/NrfG
MTVWQLGDFDETTRQMEVAIAQRPDYGQAHYLLGTALKQQGNLGGALKSLREAARLLPDDPGPLNMVGQILRIQGDLEGSKQAFAEAARIKQKKEAEQSETLRQKK